MSTPPPPPPPPPPPALGSPQPPPLQPPAAVASPSLTAPTPQLQQLQQLQQQSPPGIAVAPSPTNNNSANKARNRSWDENYAELLTYKATHNGSTDVPLTYKNDRILGKWVAHLREHQNQASLSDDRKDALNRIGFVWNPHEQKWQEMYAKLVLYKASTGHCKVPTNWKQDRKLGKWVMRQREKRKNNLLPDHRLQKLEAIGFVWKIYTEPKARKSTIIDERWQQRYQELVDYQLANAHANVPKDFGPLGKWVQEQRVMHQRKLLKMERKKLLEDIGFVFSYRAQKCQQDWNTMYELLKASSTTTEDGQFKVLGMDNGLSRWVHRQKEAYKNHRLDAGREVLLTKLNFQFPQRLPLAEARGEGMAGTPTNAANGSEDDLTPMTNLKVPPGPTSESERQCGIQLAEGLEVLAKYMDVTPSELSDRLALASAVKTEPKEAPAAAPERRESPRKKAAKKPPPKLPTNQPATPKPNKEVNAFARLLPSIVQLQDKDEDVQEDAVKALETFIKQEKGWDPRPSEGDTYHRLLALAAELGVLLDAYSERCQSIITTAEFQLERLLKKQKRKADDAPAGDDEDEEVQDYNEEDEDDEDGEEPPTKRVKVEAEEDEEGKKDEEKKDEKKEAGKEAGEGGNKDDEGGNTMMI